MHDGGGLILVRSTVGGNWIFRYSISGRRREMGLGPYPTVTLAEARQARDRWETVLRSDRDPIAERRRQREAEIAARDAVDPTLEELVRTVFDAIKGGLRGGGDRGRWMSPLAVHVLPKIGQRRAATLTATDLSDALQSLWREKHPTAEKAIQRLGIVYRRGKLMGLPVDPFTVLSAQHILGEVHHENEHIAATRWQDAPALYQKLGGLAAGRMALRMTMLTLARSASVRGMRFDEVEGNVWTIPAERMKGRQGKVRDFRVPLSAPAMQLLEASAEVSEDFVFPSYYAGRGVSETALRNVLNNVGEAGRIHGFRTTFRTWVQDNEICSRDVAETVLAHKIAGKTEASYARSDLLDRRREVMAAWATYLEG